MTNKQDVEILNRIRCSIHEDSIEEQALVYAIDALEGKGTNVPSNSTISRTAAIDAVEFGITYAKAIDVNTGESKELFKEGNDALKKAVERLKELPSAQPEHEGYWINKGIFTNGLGISWHCWECSKCHSQKTSTSNFCPDCGTKMKGVKHESD